jgi:hypothetical protein
MSKHAGLVRQNGFSLGVFAEVDKKALQNLTFCQRGV